LCIALGRSQSIPLREVADLVLMLAGDRAAHITGAGLTIDGGLIKAL
jgi:NAD(P)-dependent dehydrogenase (short-subunit alcohol dehydrogenase family)